MQASWFSPNEQDRRQHYLKPLKREDFLGIYYCVSESGMIDQVLYEDMLGNHFFPEWREYADLNGGKNLPLLFIPDFPDTHRQTPQLLASMTKHHVILCTLPHNSSTLLQWLDLKFFKLLKKWMRHFFSMLISVQSKQKR